ncbi:MAG: FtsX-like permease family protein [Peptostreptococcaceae bacterium]
MKNYSYLVNRHFKVHKKRGLLTVLGIVSGIILFFTIGYLSNYMNDVNIINSKKYSGNYDAYILDVDKSSAEKIMHNIKVDQCGFYKIDSTMEILVGNVQKDIGIYKLDSISMKDIFNEKFKLIEGKYPQKSKEVVMTSQAKKQLNINIGDNISIEDVEYKIVGFYDEENNINNYYLSGFTYLDRYNLDDTVNIALRVNDNHNTKKYIEDIVKDVGLDFDKLNDQDKIELNSDIINNKKLVYYDDGITYINEERILLGILNMVVLILTVILTYGAINVSLNERKAQFATLRCIGATPSKVKALLIKESFLLGLFSLIPGIIIAQILSWIITQALINKSFGISYEELGMKIYFNVIINTILLIAINIFCATIIPVIKVGKLSPIEIVKSKDIENKNIKIRKSNLIRRVFGYTGELAYKNIRANNKNFIITTIALSFILVVIVGFNGYKIAHDKYYEENIKRLKDISIDFNPDYDNIKDDIERFTKGVKDLNVDSKFYTITNFNTKAILEGATYNKNINEIQGSSKSILTERESIYSSNLNVMVVNDEYINEILPYIENEDGKINKFTGNDFIVVNQSPEDNIFRIKQSSPISVNTGNIVNLYFAEDENNNNFDNIENSKPIKMNYLGFIDRGNLINQNSFGYSGYLTLMVSNDFYLKHNYIFKDNEFNSFSISMELDKKQNEDISIERIEDYVSMNSANLSKEKVVELEYKESVDLYFKLISLALVFIIIISAISIINTRNININMRIKEFKILLSIGMKKSKIIKMIFLEGIVAWFISTCIGGFISIVILILINMWYLYIGSLYKPTIPFGLVFGGIIIILAITTITSAVTYYKFKNLDLNDLMEKEE